MSIVQVWCDESWYKNVIIEVVLFLFFSQCPACCYNDACSYFTKPFLPWVSKHSPILPLHWNKYNVHIVLDSSQLIINLLTSFLKSLLWFSCYQKCWKTDMKCYKTAVYALEYSKLPSTDMPVKPNCFKINQMFHPHWTGVWEPSSFAWQWSLFNLISII